MEREKLYPGPGLEPGLLASHAIQEKCRAMIRINFFEPSFLTSGPTNSVVITTYRDMHSYSCMTFFLVFTTI